jgi:hypothetical protein
MPAQAYGSTGDWRIKNNGRRIAEARAWLQR